jgi:hypothetical protein
MAFPSSAPSYIARLAPSPANGDIRCAASPSSVTPGTRSHLCSTGSAWIGRKHGIRLSVGKERYQLRSPAVEFCNDAGQSRSRVGEVDQSNPVLRLVQRHVCMQHAIGLTVREDAFPRRRRHQRATANRFRAGLVAGLAVEQVRLDEGGAGICRFCLGKKRTNS